MNGGKPKMTSKLQRTKERLGRCEKLINDLYSRLQALEMDNVKGKAGLKHHIENVDGAHKI